MPGMHKMYDEMWEDHTEDIFQSITIKQALRTPSKIKWGEMGFLSKLWTQSKLLEESIFSKMINRYQYQGKNKSGTIKFRRYSPIVGLEAKNANKKTVVREVNTQTKPTLGISGSLWRSVPCCVPGLTCGNFYYLEEE